MPTYEVPEIVEVALNDLDLPAHVPVDPELTTKPLAHCNRDEVEVAIKAFSGLVQHAKSDIENSIQKYIEIRRRVAHLEAYREHFDDVQWVRDD